MRRWTHLAFAALLALTWAGTAQPTRAAGQREADWEMIQTPAGPEDMALDDAATPPRLLVSCTGRRKGADNGCIVSVDLADHAVRIMPRVGDDLRDRFHPHGISLVARADGARFLYVISHDRPKKSTIRTYRVEEDRLVRAAEPLKSPLLKNPNDLVALPSGEIYVTNGYGPSVWLSFFEWFLRLRSSSVAHYDPAASDPKKAWRIFAKGIRYANGVYADDRRLFVDTTRGGDLLAYDLDAPLPAKATNLLEHKLPGLDNIMPVNTRQGLRLLIPRETELPWAFARHRADSHKPSPSVVCSIDPINGAAAEIDVEAGDRISAVSTAVAYGDKLYLSQVFDGFILALPRPESIRAPP